MFRKKRSMKTIIEGLLIAGSLGALATFVFGTKKGRELKHQAWVKCKKVGRKAAKAAPSMRTLKRISKKAIKAAPSSIKTLKKIGKIVEMKKHKPKAKRHKRMKRAA